MSSSLRWVLGLACFEARGLLRLPEALVVSNMGKASTLTETPRFRVGLEFRVSGLGFRVQKLVQLMPRLTMWRDLYLSLHYGHASFALQGGLFASC